MPPIIIASTKPRIGKTAFVASLSKILSASTNIKPFTDPGVWSLETNLALAG